MNSPKVSIIIPVYNTAKYLDECMDSVLNQTEKDIEIILVDDGSTDGISPKKCDEYGAKDGRIKVIHKENGGLMSAWIRGTEEATAPYVCYLDSDDWIDTDMIESLYKETSAYGASKSGDAETTGAGEPFYGNSEIISSNYIVEKAGERRKETQSLAPGVYTGKELDSIRRNLLGNEVRPVTMSRCMKLTSRKLILDNIRFCNKDIKMAEDVNIMLPCLCDCKRLVIVKDGYFYHYRLLGDSMAHGYNDKLLTNLDLCDTTFRSILRDKGIDKGDEQLDKEYVIMLFVVLKNLIRSTRNDTVKRVRDLFTRSDIRAKVLGTNISVNSKANSLLYFCMKHPNALVILVTKAILGAYDKRTN